MRERPILFSSPMVRKVRAGLKTQTRRLVKPEWQGLALDNVDTQRAAISKCPKGQPGDRLWVRESFAMRRDGSPLYMADSTHGRRQSNVWKPSIFMPRSVCRAVLDVTRIRIERVQAISGTDITAEGVDHETVGALWEDATRKRRREAGMRPDRPTVLNVTNAAEHQESRLFFQPLSKLWEIAWTLINGRASWLANPFVWVIDFSLTEEVPRG